MWVEVGRNWVQLTVGREALCRFNACRSAAAAVRPFAPLAIALLVVALVLAPSATLRLRGGIVSYPLQLSRGLQHVTREMVGAEAGGLSLVDRRGGLASCLCSVTAVWEGGSWVAVDARVTVQTGLGAAGRKELDTVWVGRR